MLWRYIPTLDNTNLLPHGIRINGLRLQPLNYGTFLWSPQSPNSQYFHHIDSVTCSKQCITSAGSHVLSPCNKITNGWNILDLFNAGDDLTVFILCECIWECVISKTEYEYHMKRNNWETAFLWHCNKSVLIQKVLCQK